jgi:hypothetical protein
MRWVPGTAGDCSKSIGRGQTCRIACDAGQKWQGKVWRCDGKTLQLVGTESCRDKTAAQISARATLPAKKVFAARAKAKAAATRALQPARTPTAAPKAAPKGRRSFMELRTQALHNVMLRALPNGAECDEENQVCLLLSDPTTQEDVADFGRTTYATAKTYASKSTFNKYFRDIDTGAAHAPLAPCLKVDWQTVCYISGCG